MVNQSGLHEKIREASLLEPDLEVLAVLFSPLPIPPTPVLACSLPHLCHVLQ